jgi:hypothetical protein
LEDPDVVPKASSILAVSTAAQALETSKAQEVGVQRKRVLQRRAGVSAATTGNELGVIPLPAAPRSRSAVPPKPAALAGIHVPKWENLTEDEHLTAEGGP